MKKMAFTKTRLDALPVPETGRYYVYDTKNPGLTVCVTATGRKTFYFCRRINGPYQRIIIGRCPGLSVEQARREASKLTGQIAQGIDPQAAKRSARAETTLGVLWDHYLAKHARPHKKPRSCQEDERLYKRHLEKWANRRLSHIHKGEVQDLHVSIGNKTLYEANRMLALVHVLFNHARDLGFDGPNPADRIRKFREASRERFLQVNELQKFFGALRNEPKTQYRDFFLMCLFTGARRGNVQSMRWNDLNMDGGTWTIPDTKSGRPQTVVLTAPAIAILSARRAGVGDSEWVFPGRHPGHYLGEPGKVWKAVLNRASIRNLRIHDLRRTLGSWAAAGGASLQIIGKALGHHDLNTTAIYSRLNLDSVRAVVEGAVQSMLTAANGQASALALPSVANGRSTKGIDDRLWHNQEAGAIGTDEVILRKVLRAQPSHRVKMCSRR